MNTVAAGYSRVSTTGQDNERQIQNVRKFAESKGMEVQRFFSDSLSGESLTVDREGFSKMIAYMKKEGLTVIVTSELSRIGRRVRDVVDTIYKLVEDHGFTVHVQHPMPLEFKRNGSGKIDPLSAMMLTVLSVGAEMELENIRNRMREGVAIAKKQGKFKGRVKGSTYSRDQLLARHSDIVNLLKHSSLPDTKIAEAVKKGLSTVKRVKKACI